MITPFDIILVIIFAFIVGVCCCSDSGNTSNNTSKTGNVKTYNRRSTGHASYSYSECPSCGAPYYDGYCEECGYPDINQGWLGEEYG